MPQTSVGDNPDIGAIDQSNLWTPGIDWSPVEEFQIENMYTTLNKTFLNNNKVFIYPNPTYGMIRIENAQISKWKIFDFRGQLLKTGDTNWVDLSSYENGLYLLQLDDVSEKNILTIIKK